MVAGTTTSRALIGSNSQEDVPKKGFHKWTPKVLVNRKLLQSGTTHPRAQETPKGPSHTKNTTHSVHHYADRKSLRRWQAVTAKGLMTLFSPGEIGSESEWIVNTSAVEKTF